MHIESSLPPSLPFWFALGLKKKPPEAKAKEQTHVPLMTSWTSSSTRFISASYPFNVPVTVVIPLTLAIDRGMIPTHNPSLPLPQESWERGGWKGKKGTKRGQKHTFAPAVELDSNLLVHIL